MDTRKRLLPLWIFLILLCSSACQEKNSKRAEYALNATIALDKSGYDVDNDSLLRIAYDYYSSRTNDTLYYKCMYYMGKYYALADSAGRAKDCLTEALLAAEKANDKYMMCLAMNQLTKVLREQYPDSALSYAKREWELHNSLPQNKPENTVYTLLNLR